jgi:bifunctional DNA-binding transcriptional regulator/antitoxin component of YhaV-PrlF toxin-antitoxin module
MAFLKARARIGAAGRLVIARDIRAALQVREGDALLLQVDDRALHIRSVRHAVHRARQLVARYVKPGRSLSAESIAERRRAARTLS